MTAMNNLDKHYSILGLRRGATQKEIHSAFRQMAKLYHPDQDASTYAQMRYHEARQAYDALRKTVGAKTSEPTTGAQQATRDNNFTGARAGANRTTTCGAGWYASEYEYKHDGGFDFSDLLGRHGAREKIKERIPFSLGNVLDILLESIREVASVGMLVRVLLCVAVQWIFVFNFIGLYSGLTSLAVISCSLIGFFYFRYYFAYDQNPTAAASNFAANFAYSMLYSVGVGFLLNYFNPIRWGWVSGRHSMGFMMSPDFYFGSWFKVSLLLFPALLPLWLAITRDMFSD